MKTFASTTRNKGENARQRYLDAFVADAMGVLVIKPRKKGGALSLSLGRFSKEDGGLIEWMLHPKQGYLGGDDVTVSTLRELGVQGPSIPVLLSALPTKLKGFVEEHADTLHDWVSIDAEHPLNEALTAQYREGGSLDAVEAWLEQEEQEEAKEEEAAAAAAKAPEEPRRGRSMRRRPKREPSSSPAEAKAASKKAVSPKQQQEQEEQQQALEEEVTPAAGGRRSARLAKAAAEATTPASLMRKLDLAE